MKQKTSKKILSDLRKKYQISFRRWLMAGSGGGTVAPYVGADITFIRNWISERLLDGMTWNNYGDLWVIDHIVPLRLFDFTSENDKKIALHYKNIMPLFREDNLYKEGAIDFSLLILDHIPYCDIVEKLQDKLRQESQRLHKYLPNQSVYKLLTKMTG